MPLEQRRSEISSIFLINEWVDQQGSLDWKRFYDYSEPERRYISTKHNTWGLSGRYYYQFSNPDAEIKTIHAKKIDKLKVLLPSPNESEKLTEVPSLKDVCGKWFAKQETDLNTLTDQLPPDLLKFVSFLKKKHSVRDRKDRSHQQTVERMQVDGDLDYFETQLLKDIGITDSTLQEHRNEILALIFRDGHDTSKFAFDKKKIASMLISASQSIKGKGPRVKLILPGEPTISLSSRSRCPYLLPWKITVSLKRENLPKLKLMSVLSYSPEISKLLLNEIGPAIDPYNRANLQGVQWWKNPMWMTYLAQ
jgi:hypothetical protein